MAVSCYSNSAQEWPSSSSSSQSRCRLCMCVCYAHIFWLMISDFAHWQFIYQWNIVVLFHLFSARILLILLCCSFGISSFFFQLNYRVIFFSYSAITLLTNFKLNLRIFVSSSSRRRQISLIFLLKHWRFLNNKFFKLG